MSQRWKTILSRFPAHMEATREGKQFASVVESIAADMDTLSSATGRVRKAHRLADADEIRDLFLLGGLHGITRGELGLLISRFAITGKLLETAAANNAGAEAVGRLWGIAPPGFRLNRYAIDQPASASKTRARFIAYARGATNMEALADAVRRRIAAIAAIHAQGNGDIHALATGAANALDCDVLAIQHSADRYLHRAIVVDRLRLKFPVVQGNAVTDREFFPAEEEILIEENPLERQDTGSFPRKNGQLFPVIRRGFERTLLTLTITGTGVRTVGPMLVNRDEGAGIGFAGLVPEASTLVIDEEGRAVLDGSDATALAYSWKGACFADALNPHRRDFVFGGPGAPLSRTGQFAATTPAGALDAMFPFPHAGDNVTPLGLDVGESRFAFFVQEGFFSHREPDGTIQRIQPRPAVAFADGSVFAPGPGATADTAALLSLSWLERCAFRARIWMPRRFLQFTPADAEGTLTRRQVLESVERFRPAGVRLDAEFSDNRWTLGRGVVFGAEAQPPAQGPGIGMELWNAPEET